MKITPKCPLCGGKAKYFIDDGDGYCEHVGCVECGLYAKANWGEWGGSPNEEIMWQRWCDLVFKFPPIMRLNQGDNVLVWLSDDIHTVLGVDLEAGKIHLQDVYGDAESCYSNGIKKWPWELEQAADDAGETLADGKEGRQ